MIAYIYAIKNLINNKVYIGSTKSFKNRKYEHFWKLKKGIHHSEHLQKSYNKYGKDFFSFYIIEECSIENRKEKELYHIDQFKAFERNFGYNTHEPNQDKFKCSDETKQKIRESKRNSTFRPMIPIDLYKTTGEFVCLFETIIDCARFLSIPNGIFTDILKGRRKSFKGYTVVHKGTEFTYKTSLKQRDMKKYYKYQ